MSYCRKFLLSEPHDSPCSQYSACSAASGNCTLPFFLPHPSPSKFKVWRKRLQSPIASSKHPALVLTLPSRPDWNCLILQFWPHPLLQHPVNSPFKLGFYAVFFLKLPLIFPHTVCLEAMTIGNFKPCLGWVNQREAAGNACWAGVPLLSPFGGEPSLGLYAGFAKHCSNMNPKYCSCPSSPFSLHMLCYSSHGDTLPLLLCQHSCLWNSCHELDQGTAFSGNWGGGHSVAARSWNFRKLQTAQLNVTVPTLGMGKKKGTENLRNY